MARVFGPGGEIRRPRGHRRVVYIAALFLVFAVFAKFRPQIESAFGVNEDSGVVAKVVDGDTIVLADGRSVRYLGIDTPEMSSFDERKREFARMARERNRELVDGERIRLEFDTERKDKYGRTLAHVYVGDKSINAQLLAEGLAETSYGKTNRLHIDKYRRIEDEAKAAGTGIWASAAPAR